MESGSRTLKAFVMQKRNTTLDCSLSPLPLVFLDSDLAPFSIGRLKPQLHKHAPAYAGFKTFDFSPVRAGGLRFYSCEFHSPGLVASAARFQLKEKGKEEKPPILLPILS